MRHALCLQIRTGGAHGCTETRCNRIYCRGDDTSVQLGDGTTTQCTTPAVVSTQLTFTQVSDWSLLHLRCGGRYEGFRQESV
jgi:hypothetical protein